jgi:hypothetical protein
MELADLVSQQPDFFKDVIPRFLGIAHIIINLDSR